MKYWFLLLFPSLLSSISAYAVKEVTLRGYIGVEGGESFSYNITFTDSMGSLKGYSVTYIEEPKETRSAISGSLDRTSRTLSFRELNIMYNHGFHSNNTMCLIDVTLKYMPNTTSTGYILKGTYKSADASATYCGMGTVTFINDDVIKTLFENAAPADTVAVAKKQPATPKRPAGIRVEPAYPSRPQPAPQPVVRTAEEITTGVEKIYDWHSDTAIVDVWDGGTIDGDRITILYNGKKILNNYQITASKMQLHLPISPTGVDVLTIVANNEGSEPPNTANLLLTDGSQVYNIIAYNDVGHEAVIKIKRAR